MKNTIVGFSKVFGTLIMVVVFALVLGFSPISALKVNAQQGNAPAAIMDVSPSTITKGQSATLSWSSINATHISITPGVGSSLPSSGERPVSPSETTTYRITVRDDSGDSATGTVTLIVRTGTTDTCQDEDATNYGGSLPCRYDDDDEKPEVTTERATDIDEDRATLNGHVDGNGLPTRVWFEWGEDRDDLDEDTSKQSTGSDTDDFDARITGLDDDTTYYFRAIAENSAGIDRGNILSFRTDEEEDDDDNDIDRICRDTRATNFRGSLPCRFVVTNAQPLVDIFADSTDLAFNGATTVRWNTLNVSSCVASGAWSGPRSIGPGSFFTGSLTSARTYILTCSGPGGTASDSVTVGVRPRTIITTTVTPRSSLVIVNSSIDRNQPILPTLDNTQPRIGDEINYTVTYQNIGTGSISNLVLRLDLPFEVDYLFSNPNNPTRAGNSLIFSLGTLRANGTGTVTVRVRVREDAAPGALLNFPATLSYTDPAGFPQSVSANVSAQVWRDQAPFLQEQPTTVVPLGASIFGAGFWPTSLFGWLLFLILILVLVALVRSLYSGNGTPFTKKTVTTVQH